MITDPSIYSLSGLEIKDRRFSIEHEVSCFNTLSTISQLVTSAFLYI